MIKQIVFLESGLRKNSISNSCFSADIHMRMVIENFYKNFRKNGEICSKFAVKNQNVWSLFPGSDNFRCWSRVAFADFDQNAFRKGMELTIHCKERGNRGATHWEIQNFLVYKIWFTLPSWKKMRRGKLLQKNQQIILKNHPKKLCKIQINNYLKWQQRTKGKWYK